MPLAPFVASCSQCDITRRVDGSDSAGPDGTKERQTEQLGHCEITEHSCYTVTHMYIYIYTYYIYITYTTYCIYIYICICSYTNILFVFFFPQAVCCWGSILEKKSWPHSLAAPLNSVAGLCGPALCPGLVPCLATPFSYLHRLVWVCFHVASDTVIEM